MSKSTRATKALEQAGVAFSVHAYDYDPDADKIGMAAAEALGEPPQRVLKTLVALVDGKPVCVVLRSDREVSMKKLAAALGGKAAEMMKPAEAERISGYKIGGVSPFGQNRRLRTAIDADAARRALRLCQRRPTRPAGAAESTGCSQAARGGGRADCRLNLPIRTRLVIFRLKRQPNGCILTP